MRRRSGCDRPRCQAALLGPDHHEQIAHADRPNAADRLLAVKASLDPDNAFSAIPLPAARPSSKPLERAGGEA